MTVAIRVQHELHSAVDTSHLIRAHLFGKDACHLVVSSRDHCFNEIVHYLLLILLVIRLLDYPLDYLPETCYMSWLLDFFGRWYVLLHGTLEVLLLSCGKSSLFLLLFVDAFLPTGLSLVGPALGAPLATPI